jgi:hypothetical protein
MLRRPKRSKNEVVAPKEEEVHVAVKLCSHLLFAIVQLIDLSYGIEFQRY